SREYRDSGRLSSTTLFISGDVANLYTMIPRDGAILALQKFLNKYTQNHRITGMTIDTITKLARLVLDTNCFVFEDKYYLQIRGEAMGSPFTMTLANIYMFEWEQSLIEYQKAHNEIYDRYIDDFFMKTNSLSDLKVQLNIIETKDANTRITTTTSSKIEFLDVLVENNHGQLRTSVFHKPTAEPYIIPVLSDHPRHVHRNTIKGQLIRAARLCSHLEDFNKERLNIEFTLLLNGYPSRFISYHFKKFFQQNNISLLMEEPDQTIYQSFHRHLINKPTRREHQMQQRPSNINQCQYTNKKAIRVHYTFETSPILKFSDELRSLRKQHYQDNHPLMKHVALHIGTTSNRNLNQLLVKKKPPQAKLIQVSRNTATTAQD
ncbi:unnamed protein product, partial [Adineta ricciae]